MASSPRRTWRAISTSVPPTAPMDCELWKSDGTKAGTVLVKDIDPGCSSSDQEPDRVGGDTFFTADTAAHGRELWKSDGTKAGTTWSRTSSVAPADVDVPALAPHSWRGTIASTAASCGSRMAPPPARSFSKTSIQVARARTPLSSRELGTPCSSRRTTVPGIKELWKSDGTAPRHEARQGHQSRELLGRAISAPERGRNALLFSAGTRWWALEERRDRSGNDAGQRRRGPELRGHRSRALLRGLRQYPWC